MLIAGLVIGVVLGVAAALWLSAPSRREPETPVAATDFDRVRNPDLAALLAVLPGAAILVDYDTLRVLRASQTAQRMKLVEDDEIVVDDLQQLVAESAGRPEVLESELFVKRSALDGGRLDAVVRVAPVDSRTALVHVEDMSSARRLDEVRRDFVANVSHELKTPVGALSLLAEAVLSASDDQETVEHFAGRMQIESVRLANLVGDLVDLSRLQGADPMEGAHDVEIDDVVTEAVDATRLLAQSNQIEVVVGGDTGIVVRGVESQLITAVRNLLSNAISYSPTDTKIVVAVHATPEGLVDVSVSDQGIGIPAEEVDRIFERFYRVDQARSRVTGGTGLGLSIVKHILRNHGGTVTVWSVEGEGSTFTIKLPLVTGSQLPPNDANGTDHHRTTHHHTTHQSNELQPQQGDQL